MYVYSSSYIRSYPLKCLYRLNIVYGINTIKIDKAKVSKWFT